MSTRSYIFVENEDGTLDGVYCHSDGYLEGVGTVLKEAYSGTENDQKRHDLIALGDLSCIGRSLEPSAAVELFGFGYFMKAAFNELSQHTKKLLLSEELDFNYTTAYHRDRGEEKKIIHRDNCKQLLQELNHERTADILSWNTFTMIEYIYVWFDEQWWVIDTGEEKLKLRHLDCALNSLNN